MGATRRAVHRTTAGTGATAKGRRPPLLDAMVVPAVAVLTAVVLYPTVRAVVLSTYHDELLEPHATRFVAGANFATLLHDTVFWTATRNTMTFTLTSVALGFVLGLGLAVLTDRVPPPLRFVRGALLTPWARGGCGCAWRCRSCICGRGGLGRCASYGVGC